MMTDGRDSHVLEGSTTVFGDPWTEEAIFHPEAIAFLSIIETGF